MNEGEIRLVAKRTAELSERLESAALKWRDHRSGHDVFLDATDSGDCLRCDTQGLSFFRRLIRRNPEMHRAVAYEDVLGPDLRPFLAAELGEQLCTD